MASCKKSGSVILLKCNEVRQLGVLHKQAHYKHPKKEDQARNPVIAMEGYIFIQKQLTTTASDLWQQMFSHNCCGSVTL